MAYPEIYRSWAAMSQALMNGPSPLTSGERELILAYAWNIRRGLLEEMLKDPATAAVEPKLNTVEKSFDASGHCFAMSCRSWAELRSA